MSEEQVRTRKKWIIESITSAEVTDELWTNLMNEARVKLKTTALSTTDSKTDRTNRVIIEIISEMTNNRLKWDYETTKYHSTAVNSSTKLTPDYPKNSARDGYCNHYFTTFLDVSRRLDRAGPKPESPSLMVSLSEKPVRHTSSRTPLISLLSKLKNTVLYFRAYRYQARTGAMAASMGSYVIPFREYSLCVTSRRDLYATW
ncbi:hypothetical protein ACTFIU_005679 [Dictyostelium citrinum]